MPRLTKAACHPVAVSIACLQAPVLRFSQWMVLIPPRGGTSHAERRSPMPEVICWQQADPSAVIDRAVALLTAGKLVIVPTETGYEIMASAQHPAAVERLAELSGTSALRIGLATPAHLLEWAPRISPLGMRFARRGWPGPLVLILRPD